MSELETKFCFDWEIPKELLHSFYFKQYKEKKDSCMSPLYTHKYTQTIWALSWYPYGDSNSRNDNESQIYLYLINKPSEMKSVTINKTIYCKQLNLMLKDNDNHTYDQCIGYGFKEQKYIEISEMKKHECLNFKCEITFIKQQFDGGLTFFLLLRFFFNCLFFHYAKPQY